MAQPAELAFLDMPGEMPALIRQKDWSTTPFGPIEQWSPALRSAVSICLGSRFPMVLYWGPTRALIYNDAWSPVLGQKHPWALGRPGWEAWSEIWDIIGPMFDQVMEQGEATWSEDQLLPLNRFGYVEECYFYYSYSPVRGDDGVVEGIFTAVTETTYRVLAERRERLLREVSETTSQARTAEEVASLALQRLASVPEESPFAAVYLYQDGVLRRAACHGLEAGHPLVPDILDASTPWSLPEDVQGDPVLVDLRAYAARLPRAPWPENIEQGLVVPIPGTRTDARYGVLVTGLSARRRLDTAYGRMFERAAGHMSHAIANVEAYEEERRRAEQLAELDRAKTAFFSNASHEFRTPLTLMLGPVEEMLVRPGDVLSVERESLSLVHRNGQRLLRLVNTLLDFSRIEAGRVQASYEPVEIGAFTAELASSFRSAMERAGLAYRIDCPVVTELLWLDREMWEKIVLNLISNAFKYTLTGTVEVALRQEENGVRLTVRDTGVGIPEDHLERVFERFHRIEGQDGRTHEGTGIGLALVKDLVALHAGDVTVTSRVGEGACFGVFVPFGTAHVPRDNASSSRKQASTATGADTFVSEALRWLPDAASGASTVAETVANTGVSHGKRILLADDNADMRGYVERLLVAAGYQVEATTDGQAALDALQRGLPDLLLSDVMMPRLDGFGLIRAVRNQPATADLPIILLSARAGEDESIEGIEAGADDYLVKPFSARELVARVEGALRLAGQRRESRDALRAANEDLEQRVMQRTRERDRFWTYSHDLIGIADVSGNWQAVNPAWRKVLGWRVEDILGRTLEWAVHPDDVASLHAELRSLAAGRSSSAYECRLRTRAGDYRTLSWTAVPEEGQLYCVARDVTEERARIRELEQAQAALRQSQKMEAIGQLTGGIAHDFNNMLTGIIGSLDLLQRRGAEQIDARGMRYLDVALGAAQRAASLTQRLLAFGRRQPLDLKPVDVNALIRSMQDLVDRTLGENITLTLDLAEPLWLACSDHHQLENVLLNLCLNARDAMSGGGHLVVRTANNEQASGAREQVEPESYVELSVIDTGVGIPAEMLEKVFEPFFTTKPLGKGTGLGLSMVYGFVRQSEGHVDIASVPGSGTTVRLLLPRFDGDAASRKEAASRQTPVGRGEIVLVVEDEADVRSLIVEVLGELGYAALEAGNAQDALSILQAAPHVDLVVSDIGLPGMNGLELVKEVRRRHPVVEVLLITGYAEEASARQDFLGANMQLMTKPFSVDDLAGRVRKMLGNQR